MLNQNALKEELKRQSIKVDNSETQLGKNSIGVTMGDTGMGSVGYKGYWHLGIKTVKPIEVIPNMKCCQIYYYTLEGEIENTYQGSMQNLPPEELGSQLHKILKKENCD